MRQVSSRSAIFSLCLNSVGGAAGLVLDLLLTNSMESSDFGLFRYIYTFCIIAAIGSSYGANQYLLKFFSLPYSNSRKVKELKCQLVLAFGATLAYITIFGSISMLKLAPGPISLLIFCLVAIWIFARVIFIVFRAICLASHDYIRAQIADRIIINFFPIVAVGLVAFSGGIISLELVVLQSVVAIIISAVFLYSRKHVSIKEVLSFELEGRSIVLRFKNATNISVSELIDALNRMGLVLILGAIMSAKELAILVILMRLVDSLGLVTSATSAVYLPYVLKEYKEGLAPNSASRMAWINFYFCLAAAAVFLMFGSLILGYFGSDYENYGSFVVLLFCSQLVKVALGPVFNVLIAARKSDLVIKNNAFYFLVLSVSSIILTHYFGLVGAVIAAFLCTIAQSVSLSVSCYRNLGLYIGIRI